MAKSLQEQLLKAGLVDEKKSKQIKQQKRKQSKLVKQGKAEADDIAERAKQSREQQAERNRQINLEKQLKADEKALLAQVKQLIERHRIKRPDDGIAYQFVDEKKVKRLFVTELQQDQLARGILAIVRQAAGYEVVPSKTAEKIKQRWPEAVVLLNQAATNNAADEDDPYADYQIPDDLMW